MIRNFADRKLLWRKLFACVRDSQRVFPSFA